MGWPKMREQTPFPRMTETDKATDDVTSGMQGACDGLLTHIVHCDTVRSAPACISVSDFPASVASPSSLLLMVTSSRAARSQSMQCTAHPTLYIFPTDFCLTNTLPLPTIHFSTYIDTLFRKTATVRRTPTSFWLPRLPIRARLRHSVRSRVPFPSRVATTRFKSPLVPGADRDKSSMAVWMDCTDDRQPVATWRGTIIAKVTRISADDGYDTDEEFDMHRNQAAAGAPAAAPAAAASTPAPAADPSLDLFDSPATAPAPAAAAASSGDLLGVHSAAPPAPAAASGGAGSLLDMTGPPSGGHHQSAPSSAHHNDFMGMTASAPPAQQQQQQQQQQAPMQGQPMRQTMPPPQQQQQQAYRTQGSFGSQQQGGGGTFGDLQWS